MLPNVFPPPPCGFFIPGKLENKGLASRYSAYSLLAVAFSPVLRPAA